MDEITEKYRPHSNYVLYSHGDSVIEASISTNWRNMPCEKIKHKDGGSNVFQQGRKSSMLKIQLMSTLVGKEVNIRTIFSHNWKSPMEQVWKFFESLYGNSKVYLHKNIIFYIIVI